MYSVRNLLKFWRNVLFEDGGATFLQNVDETVQCHIPEDYSHNIHQNVFMLLQVHETSLFSSEYSNPSHNAVLTVHSPIYLKYLGKNICQELTNLKYMPVSAGGYSTATAAGSISCTSSVYMLNVQKRRCLKQLVGGGISILTYRNLFFPPKFLTTW